MRLKTHSSIGDLMFREFDSLDDLHAALEAHREELPFTQLTILQEDKTSGSGWSVLASSTHIIDLLGVPSSETNDVSEISDALDRGAFVRWMLFCDEYPMCQCLSLVIGLHGVTLPDSQAKKSD